jgi:hypothetical protein
MWYECNSCGSKIDSSTANLYCRSHEHDFVINQAEMLAVPYFKLKENASTATAAAVRVHIYTVDNIDDKEGAGLKELCSRGGGAGKREERSGAHRVFLRLYNCEKQDSLDR